MALGDIPPIMITGADIYGQLIKLGGDTQDILGRISVIQYRNEMHDRTALDHEKRIRALERFKWILLGVVVATSTLSGIVTALISAKL